MNLSTVHVLLIPICALLCDIIRGSIFGDSTNYSALSCAASERLMPIIWRVSIPVELVVALPALSSSSATKKSMKVTDEAIQFEISETPSARKYESRQTQSQG